MSLNKFFERLKKFHFEFRHLTVLFIILLLFQLIVSLINKSSITSFLNNTKEWYKKDAVEKIANLTATSLELTIEFFKTRGEISKQEQTRIIQSLNIIFSQQLLQHDIEELSILVSKNNTVYKINEGKELYSFLNEDKLFQYETETNSRPEIQMYKKLVNKLKSDEQIISITDPDNKVHVFVPFVIRGEILGAVYMKSSPNFNLLSDQLFAQQDETTIIYISLILLGFISMYFISSYTVKERDEAQKKLLIEHEENLKKQFDYQKEMVFTRRIYHTHHKAEKIMGFIKEDLNKLDKNNIAVINNRVIKYSNFISRVIYDMKWFDPPVQTIRGTEYQTNLNEVLKFIVENIFLRVSNVSDSFKFIFNLDNKLPVVHVNEFVIWELLEPLIQNAIEHSGSDNITITIKTYYNPEDNSSTVSIIDNGKGISENLLIKNNEGIENIFLENVSTKTQVSTGSGYGCYIAYQIAKRCGWQLGVSNNSGSGSTFTIFIKNA